MRILCLMIAFIMLFSGISVSADGLDYVDDAVSDQNRIVTEYYTEGMLETYEYGDIQASTKPITNLSVDVKSAILIEQSTGTVLYEKDVDTKMPMASITKVMSLILIMEHIESGALSLDTMLSCSAHAASMGGSQIWLEPNEQMSVNDLLKAVIVGSANDATCMLAEAVAGSEEAFVSMMNDKAKQLGMNNTYFKNCSGLDADGHYSTAKDISIMSKELLNHQLVFDYSTIWMDTLRNGETQLVNTNKLVRFYDGATGLKTGTTDDAGCCVTASAKRNGLHLIAVVMGAQTSDKRFQTARTLLDSGFANYQFKEMTFKLKEQSVTVTNGTELKAKLVTPENHSFLIEKGKENNVTSSFNIPDTITAPIKKGDTIGNIVVKLGDDILGTVDIVAAETIDEMTFKNALKRMCKYMFKL